MLKLIGLIFEDFNFVARYYSLHLKETVTVHSGFFRKKKSDVKKRVFVQAIYYNSQLWETWMSYLTIIHKEREVQYNNKTKKLMPIKVSKLKTQKD